MKKTFSIFLLFFIIIGIVITCILYVLSLFFEMVFSVITKLTTKILSYLDSTGERLTKKNGFYNYFFPQNEFENKNL